MAAQTPAEKKAQETEAPAEPDTKVSADLTADFGRQSETREWGEIHYFDFEDGTSAKVWRKTGEDHVSVQVRNGKGRGTTRSTTESITVAAANKIIESAGQKAKDAVAASNR